MVLSIDKSGKHLTVFYILVYIIYFKRLNILGVYVRVGRSVMSAENASGLTGQQVVTEVQGTSLESPLDELVEEYNEQIGIRGEYLWKWLENIWPLATLDCVPEHHREVVSTHKTILSMFITVVDDLAGNIQDKRSFYEACKVPFDHMEARPEREGVKTEHIRFLQKVWETSEAMLADAEREAEFRPLLEYDFRLGLMSMDYEGLTNAYPEMLNVPEMMDYTPHNVMMLAGADIDLMYSPSFDRADLASVREVVYRSQQLCRISNCTSTWERELMEGDLTSLVFTEALSRGLVSSEDLERLQRGDCPADAERIAESIRDYGIEAGFLKQWDQIYADLLTDISEADSVDLEAYVERVETIQHFQMASKGHK